MFKQKLKIEINDNFNMIQNYILSSLEEVTFKDLLQYCIDYDLYRELYVNIQIFELLRNEKNLLLRTENKQTTIL